ncbi:hypothetical protein BYT27DRAFT_7191193 [Phlegmacium glaucopus]|nr:hypothetical protein BYT27DRAFT_7191193 [Phlegmacium glaucopus]
MQLPKLIVLLNPDLSLRNEPITTHSGLASSSLYAASNCQAILGNINPDQDLNSIISKLRAHYLDSQTQWRIYEPVTAHPEDMALVPDNPHILVHNAMTIDPESEEDFNNWYNDEHIPLLSQTPSWLYSRRYTLVACNDDAPRYLALHSWGNRTVFDSPAYKLAIDTPWRTRVLGKLIKRERIVFDYVDDLRAQEQAKTTISITLASS